MSENTYTQNRDYKAQFQKMVPMECRDPKRIKKLLIDIEKRVEINPSRPLDEVIQLVIQGLSTKHEALDLSQG